MKSINDLSIIQYLYGYKKSWHPKFVDTVLSKDIHDKYVEIGALKNECRLPVKLSKSFIDCINKSMKAFLKIFPQIINDNNGEIGFVIDNINIKQKISIIYKIQDEIIKLYFIFNGDLLLYTADVKPTESGMEMNVFDCQMAESYNLQTLVECTAAMILTYIGLREYADVEVKTVQTYYQKEIVKAGKKKTTTEEGVPYYTFDSKWYTEICNNNIIGVSGYFKLQHYKPPKKDKIIWVNPYTRIGPHRKADIDKYKDGELIL